MSISSAFPLLGVLLSSSLNSALFSWLIYSFQCYCLYRVCPQHASLNSLKYKMRSFHLIFKFSCTASSSWPSQEQLCNSPRLSQVWQCPLSSTVYCFQGNHLEIVSGYTHALCFSLLLLPHVILPSRSCPRQQMPPWLVCRSLSRVCRHI